MSDQSDTGQQAPAAAPSRPRRASITDLFKPDQSSASANKSSSLSNAMAQAQQQSRTRRLSITALGLSGSPTRNQPVSPFGSLRDRGKSISDNSANSAIDDSETAIAEDGDPAPLNSGGLGSIGRRMSAGARAYSEGMRRSSAVNGNTLPPLAAGSAAGRPGGSPPTAGKGKFADGFNWGESLRSRAERQSISSTTGPGFGGSLAASQPRSLAQAEPQANPAPPPPKPAPAKPDHFQERILKGDFYMD